MPITKRAGQGGSTLTGDYTYPSTPIAGDLLTIGVSKFHNASGQEFSAPAGWNLVAGTQFFSSSVYTAIMWRVSDGTETGVITIPGFSSPTLAWFDDWDPGPQRRWATNPFSDVSVAEGANNAQSLPLGSLTATEDDALFVGAIGFSGSTTGLGVSWSFTVDVHDVRGMFHRILTGAATVSPVASWSNSRKSVAHMAMFETEAAPDSTYVGWGWVD